MKNKKKNMFKKIAKVINIILKDYDEAKNICNNKNVFDNIMSVIGIICIPFLIFIVMFFLLLG